MTISNRSSAIHWPSTHSDSDPTPAEEARSTERLSTSRRVRARWLHGDGTPSPYSGRFFGVARDAIDFGVALLDAHVAIEHAAARREHLLDTARAANEGQWAQIDVSTADELARVRTLAGAGRMLAQRALHAFILKHDVPGTRHGLRIVANDDGYASHIAIATPFGVEAELELGIPEDHTWSERRRFVDLVRPNGGLFADSGVHSKGAMLQSEALDALYVTAIDVFAHRIALTLRERPSAGPGYRLHFESKSGRIRVALTRIADDGTEHADPRIALPSEDRTPLLRLWKRLVESTRDLGIYRRAVVAMAIDGKPVQDGVEPRLLCERLVAVLAPMLREIARRSRTPGALVLLRDDGTGSREAVRVRSANLYERIETLPPALRSVFAPLL